MKPLYVITILSLLILGCSKEKLSVSDLKSKMSLIDIYRSVTNESIDASITITNYQANFGRSDKDKVTHITTACVSGKEICEYDRVAINDVELLFGEGRKTHQDNSAFRAIFGKEAIIRLIEDEDLDGRDGEDIEMYIPQPLELSINEVPNLSESFSLNWNADENNELGVYVIVQYTAFENPALSETHPDKLVNYINIEDTGSYTFSVDDFPSIPEDALVTLKILRGAFELSEDGNDLIRVFAISHVTGYAYF